MAKSYTYELHYTVFYDIMLYIYYIELDTGSDASVLRIRSGAISANFVGNVGGSTYDVRATFSQTLR